MLGQLSSAVDGVQCLLARSILILYLVVLQGQDAEFRAALPMPKESIDKRYMVDDTTSRYVVYQ
jgi:hypothetical protein